MKYTEAKKCLKDTDKDTLQELIEEFGEDLVRQYQSDGYELDSMQEAYSGEFSSDKDFAQNMADELGLINKELSWPYTCIDWEWAAKELMYDYFDIDGHYFRSL